MQPFWRTILRQSFYFEFTCLSWSTKKSCIEEAYTLIKKGKPSQIFFNKFPLILSSLLWYFLILRSHAWQKLFKWLILLSTRFHADFFNGLSVHRGNFSLTPEPFELLKWDFLKSIITSKARPSIAFANA